MSRFLSRSSWFTFVNHKRFFSSDNVWHHSPGFVKKLAVCETVFLALTDRCSQKDGNNSSFFMETFGISISMCFVYLTENLQYGDCQSGEAIITRHKNHLNEINQQIFHCKTLLHQPICTFSPGMSPQGGSIYKEQHFIYGLINKHY